MCIDMLTRYSEMRNMAFFLLGKSPASLLFYEYWWMSFSSNHLYICETVLTKLWHEGSNVNHWEISEYSLSFIFPFKLVYFQLEWWHILNAWKHEPNCSLIWGNETDQNSRYFGHINYPHQCNEKFQDRIPITILIIIIFNSSPPPPSSVCLLPAVVPRKINWLSLSGFNYVSVNNLADWQTDWLKIILIGLPQFVLR